MRPWLGCPVTGSHAGARAFRIAKIKAGLEGQEQKIADYKKVRGGHTRVCVCVCVCVCSTAHLSAPQSLGDRTKKKGVTAFIRAKPAWQR